MTFASELHAGGADARGDRRDLFTCQEVGVGAEELRLFHLASAGHLTNEDVLVPAMCLATFMSLQDAFGSLSADLRFAVGYHVGFLAGGDWL